MGNRPSKSRMRPWVHTLRRIQLYVESLVIGLRSSRCLLPVFCEKPLNFNGNELFKPAVSQVAALQQFNGVAPFNGARKVWLVHKISDELLELHRELFHEILRQCQVVIFSLPEPAKAIA